MFFNCTNITEYPRQILYMCQPTEGLPIDSQIKILFLTIVRFIKDELRSTTLPKPISSTQMFLRRDRKIDQTQIFEFHLTHTSHLHIFIHSPSYIIDTKRLCRNHRSMPRTEILRVCDINIYISGTRQRSDTSHHI